MGKWSVYCGHSCTKEWNKKVTNIAVLVTPAAKKNHKFALHNTAFPSQKLRVFLMKKVFVKKSFEGNLWLYATAFTVLWCMNLWFKLNFFAWPIFIRKTSIACKVSNQGRTYVVGMGSMGSIKPINFQRKILEPINIWGNRIEI